MNNIEIVNYIKQSKSAEIADLQKKFELSYREAKDLIDVLVSNGDLVYAEGVKYNYIDRVAAKKSTYAEFERRRAEAIKKIQTSGEDERPKYTSLSDYFKARRKEMEKRNMVEDDEESDDEDSETYETGDDTLRQRALKLCIERGMASVSMLQRAFPIGYIKACSIVDWMEEQGYITAAKGPWSRKVLITEEEYEQLYNNDWIDDDEFEEDDEKLSSVSDLFNFAGDNSAHDTAAIDIEEKKPGIQRLVNIFSRISESKNMPVSAEKVPEHNLWSDETEFTDTVMERMKRLIRSDIKMGKQRAVKKAESYLEAVRDTHDGKMVQVYERLVYEIKNTSNYLYVQLKKQFFED